MISDGECKVYVQSWGKDFYDSCYKAAQKIEEKPSAGTVLAVAIGKILGTLTPAQVKKLVT